MIAAAVLTAVAVALLVRGPVRPPLSVLRRASPSGVVPAVALVAVGAGGWALLDGAHLALAVIVAAAAWATWRLVARARQARAADRRGGLVLDACEAMAADLAVGQTPLAVLERACADWPELAPVAAACRLGADVPQALRELSELPGGEELRTVAAAWQVAHRSGAGLADALAATAQAIRARRRTMRTVATELAAARTTARMMLALPVLVLLMGSGLGVDPWGFLTGTPLGLGCLAVGLALGYLGMLWIQHIADAVMSR